MDDVQTAAPFLTRAARDLETLRLAEHVLKPSVVVLGGTGVAHRPELQALAGSMGSELGKRGVPLRMLGSSELLETVASRARDAEGEIRIERVALSGSVPADPKAISIATHTRELERRLAAQRATGFVVLPGDIRTVARLAAVWTAMRAQLIPEAPIFLMGPESFWRHAILDFTAHAQESGLFESHLAELARVGIDPKSAARSLALTHRARAHSTASGEITALADAIEHDLTGAPEVLARWEPAPVVFGGALVPPGSQAYERLRRLGAELGVPWSSGLGPGAMEALLRGAREANPQTPNQGIAARLPTEQRPNPYVDPDRAFVARWLEGRQHMLIEGAASAFGSAPVPMHLFVDGGMGTFSELADVGEMAQTGEGVLGQSLALPYFGPALEGIDAAFSSIGVGNPLGRVQVLRDDEETLRTLSERLLSSDRATAGPYGAVADFAKGLEAFGTRSVSGADLRNALRREGINPDAIRVEGAEPDQHTLNQWLALALNASVKARRAKQRGNHSGTYIGASALWSDGTSRASANQEHSRTETMCAERGAIFMGWDAILDSMEEEQGTKGERGDDPWVTDVVVTDADPIGTRTRCLCSECASWLETDTHMRRDTRVVGFEREDDTLRVIVKRADAIVPWREGAHEVPAHIDAPSRGEHGVTLTGDGAAALARRGFDAEDVCRLYGEAERVHQGRRDYSAVALRDDGSTRPAVTTRWTNRFLHRAELEAAALGPNDDPELRVQMLAVAGDVSHAVNARSASYLARRYGADLPVVSPTASGELLVRALSDIVTDLYRPAS